MRRLVVLFVPIAVGLGLAGCSDVAVTARAVQKSMEPTIRSGEIVAIDEHAYDLLPPGVGDIISLRAPANVASETCAVSRRRGEACRRAASELIRVSLIKRIVAGPGQTVSINREGRARVDGVVQYEPFITPCRPLDRCRLPKPVRVPRDTYFVLGDNRPYSSDSRYWGPVPRYAIEGFVTPPRS